ncbi:hypothetical protein TPHA_0I03190 [Tetrapisispora phaffii CBS 4417]|uniref:Pyridoxamine 5'-phosphate oxidase N-terminal domain-containing protein n=1 Tax=Tetrapisispora phaffii (strain ATCC 24235 / CBS 4417 / NBRC 1672 / NRRL Y-8282 / UCD 70-5) TaxID=1071381 RepID=G8BY42_TETPH|nr:hypothetical protein TPHA_0I03190 [Tetrapisispora phaffii CBS 4417]CCE64820.1 hypothetical protein TPHA_0I03190 [Tetrapisispora phaffii CBS 4417]
MSCTANFPDHLLNLIKKSKYLHLATSSTECVPSISLMNYIYVPQDKLFRPADIYDYIIFATPQNTEKYHNMEANPVVALLFHDWVTANNLSIKKKSLSQTNTPEPGASGIVESAPPSKLLNLLQELNQAELNEMSATIIGHAYIVSQDSEEESHYKKLLLKVNPDASAFILGEETVVVKVKIESCKVTDTSNNTKIYT